MSEVSVLFSFCSGISFGLFLATLAMTSAKSNEIEFLHGDDARGIKPCWADGAAYYYGSRETVMGGT
jgi:hypothetical protein